MINRLIAFIAVFAACFGPASAQTYTQDFEHVTNAWFQSPVGGAACAGSAMELSTARAHTGTHSAHVAYRFSGRGNLQFASTEFPIVVKSGDKLHLSVWIYGSGQPDFPNGGGLVLVDAGNEAFLYWLGKPLADALDGGDWKEVAADIDVTKPSGHWGGKNTGVVQWPVHLIGLGVDHIPDAPAQGEFFVDDLKIVGDPVAPAQPAAQTVPAARLWLAPESRSAGFPTPGTPIAVSVTCSLPGKVDWTATDFHEQPIDHGVLNLDETGRSRIVVTPKQSGMVYVRASLLDASGAIIAKAKTGVATYERRAVKASPSNEPLPILFGVGSHFQGLDPVTNEREVAWMREIGFKICRHDCMWGGVEPERGKWTWDLYDRIFGLLKKYDIEPLSVLAYSVQWASTGDKNSANRHDWENSPPETDAYAEFARECARRYGPVARYWEIWNEPDIGSFTGTPDQFARQFAAAYRAIKDVEPSAIVMNGGISEVRRPPDWLPKLIAGSTVKPDVFAYHSHGAFPGMPRASAFARADLKAGGWNMPVWINEAGFSSYGYFTERDQAIQLVKKMSYDAYLGDKAYLWYELRDYGWVPDDGEYNFGLMRADLSPKATAVAARTLIDELSGNQFLRKVEIKGAPQVYALLFGAPDRKSGVMALWNQADVNAPLIWNLPGRATLTDIMGIDTPLRRNGRLAAITAGAEPEFVAFDGDPTKVEAIPSPIETASQIIAAPREHVGLDIALSNPLPQSLRGVVKLAGSDGWSASPSSIAFDVPAKGRKIVSTTVTASDRSASRGELAITETSNELPADLHASLQLKGATVIGRSASTVSDLGNRATWAAPVVHLGSEHRIAIYQNVPLANLLFKGDDDLSANVSLSRLAEGVRLSVVARDDIFCQNEPSGAEWQGDSLQFAIATQNHANFEWTAALTAKGAIARLDIAPAGTKLGTADFPLVIHRDEASKETIYDLIIPSMLPDGSQLGDRFAITLLVNDNDGGGRKGYVEWTPGIGRSKDPTAYQPVVVR